MMYMCVCVCVCMYVYMYVCVYVCVCVCVFVGASVEGGREGFTLCIGSPEVSPLTLSPSHLPLWRIDLPAVEKIFKKMKT